MKQDDVKDYLQRIQDLIVDKDPDDRDKFLRNIWDLCNEAKELL